MPLLGAILISSSPPCRTLQGLAQPRSTQPVPWGPFLLAEPRCQL